MPHSAILTFKLLTAFLLIAVIYYAYGAMNRLYPEKAKRKTIFLSAGLLLWLAFLAIISQKNILDNWQAMPPRMLIVILPPLLAVIIFCILPSAGKILAYVPLHILTGLQSFRIVMELILFSLYFKDVIPVQMTFEGRNWDILTGISAIPVAWLIFKNRLDKRLIILWNVAGLILLFNIVCIAVLSTPTPLRVFMNEPANTVVAYYPFVWLPGFVVPVAYALHFFSIKKAFARE